MQPVAESRYDSQNYMTFYNMASGVGQDTNWCGNNTWGNVTIVWDGVTVLDFHPVTLEQIQNPNPSFYVGGNEYFATNGYGNNYEKMYAENCRGNLPPGVISMHIATEYKITKVSR